MMWRKLNGPVLTTRYPLRELGAVVFAICRVGVPGALALTRIIVGKQMCAPRIPTCP